MYCRGAVFDENGSYLSFATSEFEIDFNINIFNAGTYEYEYIISKLPCPTKLLFVNDYKCLIVHFNDNTINLIGWKLFWKNRLIEGMQPNLKKIEEKEI